MSVFYETNVTLKCAGEVATCVRPVEFPFRCAFRHRVSIFRTHGEPFRMVDVSLKPLGEV